jgi:hypothetical protein
MLGTCDLTAGQERVKAVVQVFGDLADRQCRRAGRRQLESEWQSVQACTDQGHLVCGSPVRADLGSGVLCPIEEQPDRAVMEKISVGMRGAGVRGRQGPQSVDRFTGHMQWLSARCQDP